MATAQYYIDVRSEKTLMASGWVCVWIGPAHEGPLREAAHLASQRCWRPTPTDGCRHKRGEYIEESRVRYRGKVIARWRDGKRVK